MPALTWVRVFMGNSGCFGLCRLVGEATQTPYARPVPTCLGVRVDDSSPALAAVHARCWFWGRAVRAVRTGEASRSFSPTARAGVLGLAALSANVTSMSRRVGGELGGRIRAAPAVGGSCSMS